MPNDLTIKAVAAATGASDNAAGPRAETASPTTPASPGQAAGPMPNPLLRLDATLGLVVIEFRDGSGKITTSIPSQRQLAAYRRWEQQHNAPPAPLSGALPGTPPGALPGTPPDSEQPQDAPPQSQPEARRTTGTDTRPVYHPATRKTLGSP